MSDRNGIPLVSIIVPVYNVKEYLKDCVNSLISQSYHNIEIVLIDDGSTDGSGAMCDALAQMDDRITVVHKANGGLSDARNVGIAQCRGELLCCVDSDDIVSHRLVELLLEGLTACDSDISIGKAIVFCGESNSFVECSTKGNDRYQWKIYTPDEALKCMLLQNEFDISACAKLYKRRMFEGIAYPVGKIYEDLATTYRLVAKCKRISFVNIPVYGYRKNREGSITSARFTPKMMELLEAYQGFYEYILSNRPALRSAAECRYAQCATTILESMYISACENKYPDIKKKMKEDICTRKKYIVMEKDLHFRRKVKIIAAALGKHFYMLLYGVYSIRKYRNPRID